jgi:hypothetical protein
VLKGVIQGGVSAYLDGVRRRYLFMIAALAVLTAGNASSVAAQSKECFSPSPPERQSPTREVLSPLEGQISAAAAVCLPGTSIELPDLPTATRELLGRNPETGAGLLLQQAAGLTQALNGAVAGISGQIAGIALDLGLADLTGGGSGGGGALVNAPLVAGSPGQELSMFAVSGVTRLSHEGYRASSALPGGNGMTPEFDETDIGLTVGLRWDASHHAGLDKGALTFGLIANYTHTEIDLGTTDVLAPFFGRTGSADVDSFSLGSFGLITDGRKYGLVTVTGTVGAPQTENYVLGSTADYDTAGIAVSAMGGVLIPMGATTLDLRGGFNFIRAAADDYADSAGIRFSDAELEEISGTVSARLSRLVKLEDGSFRPFIQGGMTQRLHYSNEVDVEGVTFSFDDADTTVFARAGVDFDIDRFLQAYVAVRGDASESMEAVAAQVGLTFKLA